MNDRQELLIVMVPLGLQEAVVDELMAIKLLSGFNIKPIQGYSRKNAKYTGREQVQGYMDFSQFEILVTEESKDIVFNIIQRVCSGQRVKYWFVPVLNSGHFVSD